MAMTVTYSYPGPLATQVFTDVNPLKVRFSGDIADGWAIGGAEVKVEDSSNPEFLAGSWKDGDFYFFVKPNAGHGSALSAYSPQLDASADGAIFTQTPQGAFTIPGGAATLTYCPTETNGATRISAVPKPAPGTRFHAWCIGGGGSRWTDPATGEVNVKYSPYVSYGGGSSYVPLTGSKGVGAHFEGAIPIPFEGVADNCNIGAVLVLNRERMAADGWLDADKAKAAFSCTISHWEDNKAKTRTFTLPVAASTSGNIGPLNNAEYDAGEDRITLNLWRSQKYSVMDAESDDAEMPAMIPWTLFSLCKAFDWTLTLDMNGGGEAKTYARKGVDGVALSAPRRDGYEFLGWTRTKDGDDTVEANLDGGLYAPLAEVETLYAKWRANTYTVTFSPNATDATLSATTATVTFGEPYGNALPSATRTGWALAGWTEDPDGGEAFTAESAVTIASDHTLYAKWQGVSLTVTKKAIGEAADVASIGRLSLRASTDGFASEVATEGDGGILSYEGASLVTYRVSCELGDTSPDREWTAKGIDLGGGTYSGQTADVSRAPGEWPMDFMLERKRICRVSFAADAHGSASVESATLPAADGSGYLAGGDVTVKAAPAAGYALSAVNFTDDATGFSIGGYDGMETDTFTIKGLSKDVTVHLSFRLVEYGVSAGVDPASEDAIVAATVEDAQGNPTAKATAESPATFKAEVSDSEDYEFAGWWTADGVKVSESNPYTPSVPSSLALVAKASAKVSIVLSHVDNRPDATADIEETCSLSVDGTDVGTSYSCMATLGDSLRCAVGLGALGDGSGGLWLFGGWKRDGEAATGMGASATVAVNAPMTLAAEVTSAPRGCVLSIVFKDADSGTALDASDMKDAVSAFPAPSSAEASADGVSLSYNASGEVAVRLPTEIRAADGAATLAITGADEFSVALYGDVTVTAEYSAAGRKTVTVGFAAGSDESMGTISLDGVSSEEADVPLSVEVERNEDVALLATPANGYEFAGWFTSEDAIGDPIEPGQSYGLKVTKGFALYASFRKATDAVFEWEGGAANMMMEWRSRTYIFATPTNPSACRVDATGYTPKSTATLSVEMFSSPDASPTERATLTNIAGQGGRRLPIRRRERFMQIDLLADVEVDAVSVSTSMGGLAQ